MANRRQFAGGCPYSDDRDRNAFIRELKQFHENRGTPFRCVPTINGRPVDLHMLYTQVTALGGWMKVNDGHKWDNIIRLLRLPKRCSNAALAVKQVYLRFLDHYEKIHFHGEDPDDDVMDCSESRSRRSQGNMLQVPMTYNLHQHEVTDASRVHLGLSLDLQPLCEYNKLAMALHSSLPNEVDMAIRTCMHMSCEGRRVLRLDKLPRLLELLVAQTGIWSEGHESLRAVCERNWRSVSGQDMGLFWDRTVDDAEVKELLEMPGRSELTDEDDFFNLTDMASYFSLEGQRILQVSIILRNLSFEECNVPVIASSPTSLKFLLLCAHCKWSNLRQTSLDTLGNIAPEILLDPIDDSIAQLIFRTITKNLLSNDRFLIIRGLEMLAGVCQLEANRKTLSKSLESRVYEQICSLLTVQDIMLLIYTLDCLYRLSALGKRACSSIAGIHRMIDILVNLLTLESQSYGQNACVRMKVIETCSLGTVQPASSGSKTLVGGHYTNHSGRTSTIQLLPGYQELDNETFASNWVKAYYEICQGRSVSQTEIYSDYQNNCIKLGKKGLVGPTQLSNYIRAVFPHVMPRRVDGGSEMILEGIKRRISPLPVTIFGPLKINSTVITAGHPQSVNHSRGSRTSSSPGRPSSPMPSVAVTTSNHSPILKAQLSAPPRSPVTPNQTQRLPSGLVDNQICEFDRGNNSHARHHHQHASLCPMPATGGTLRVAHIGNERTKITPSGTSSAASSALKSSPNRDSSTLIKSLLASKVSQNMQQRQQLLRQQLSTCGSPASASALGSQIAVTAVAPSSSPAGSTPPPVQANFTTPRTRPGQLSAMLGHHNQNQKPATTPTTTTTPVNNQTARQVQVQTTKTRLNGVQRALQMTVKTDNHTPPRSVIATANSNHEESSNSSGSFASSLDGESRPPRSLSSGSGGDLVTSLREVLHDKGKMRNGNGADSDTGAVPQQPVITKHKGVLADLLEGKVHTDALLLMNGIVDKRKIVQQQQQQQETPSLTNGDSNHPVIQVRSCGTVTTTTPTTATTTTVTSTGQRTAIVASAVVYRSAGNSDDLIGFPRVSIDQLNQIRQQENPQTKVVAVKRPPVIMSAVKQNAKRARVEKCSVVTAPHRVVAVAKTLPEPQSIKPSPAGPGPGSGTGTVTDTGTSTGKTVDNPQPSAPANATVSTAAASGGKEEDAKLEYICEWKGCKKSYERASQVFIHVCKTHVRDLSADIPCQWENCDQMIRQKYSLMTHLQDRHCSEQILHLHAMRKRDFAKSGSSSISLPPPPPPHPGYAPNAAVQAIRRHALEFVNPKEIVEEREGSVTKSVRLTAALTIRNVVLYSSTGRRLVRRYEEHLANIAVSNVESSRTIAQCLWELYRLSEPSGGGGSPGAAQTSSENARTLLPASSGIVADAGTMEKVSRH